MRSVEWRDGRVRMIDQRQLPWDLAYLEYEDYRDVAQAITDSAIQGGVAVGVTGAYGMALAAQQSPAMDMGSVLDYLEVASVILKKASPNVTQLARKVDRMLLRAREDVYSTAREIREALLKEAGQIADDEVACNQRIGKHGANLIREGDTILHHGNTGALAAVDYGTALGVLRTAHEQKKTIHVLLTESRPRLHGARLAGWELKQAGVPFEIITDSAAGHYMRTGAVKLVLVGGDRLAANGDTVADIGTYSLAVLAKENKIPFYVVLQSANIDSKLTTGEKLKPDEHPAEEVRSPYGNALLPEDFPLRNPAFDMTPQRYLAGVVTENGISLPPFRESLSKLGKTAKVAKV